jgi:hypothetical protein
VFYVADPVSSIETRLLPTLTRSYPRHFTFYVARPTRSIRLDWLLKLAHYPTCSSLPSRLCLLCRFSPKLHSTSRFSHLCRALPGGSIHSLLPSSLYLDRSHFPVLAPATLAAWPSIREIPIATYSMLLIPQLHCISLAPARSTVTSRLYRPCRLPQSLHSRSVAGSLRVTTDY